MNTNIGITEGDRHPVAAELSKLLSDELMEQREKMALMLRAHL